MSERRPGVHVVTTRREYKDRVYESHLLRRSYREGSSVKKETLANLTPLGSELVEVIRSGLRGQRVGVIEELLPPVRSLPHGHVQAVVRAMERLGMERLLASRPSRERAIILALIACRVLDPMSKLATTRSWGSTTAASAFGVEDARVDEVFAAMDWLALARERIEAKLAARHLREGGLALFDLSGSYVEGAHHELAAFGHPRDGKRGKKQVNWGVIGDAEGRPIGLRVFRGNTADPTALRSAVRALRERFGLSSFVLVGDRGMITSRHIQEFREDDPAIAWITALRAKSIQKLMLQGVIQTSLFEQTNIAEVASPDYPGERLIACRNPVLARERAHHRRALLDAASAKLEKLRASVQQGRLRKEHAIALRVGAALAQHKMRKHFMLTIAEGTLEYQIDRDTVAREAASDGIYVIRSNVPNEQKDANALVHAYKDLAHLERAFKSLKHVDLQVRPIRHRKADRTTAHLFICLLAYYVRWHMERAWAPLTFKDQHPTPDHLKDPVAPATRSAAAQRKASTRTTDDGSPTHSFTTLLKSLSTIVRNTHQHPTTGITIELATIPTTHQQRALDLIDTINP